MITGITVEPRQLAGRHVANEGNLDVADSYNNRVL